MEYCLYCQNKIEGRRKGAKYCSEKCQRAVAQKRHRMNKADQKNQLKMWVTDDIEKLRGVSMSAYQDVMKLTAFYGHSAGDMCLMAIWSVLEAVSPETLRGLE